MIKKWHIILFMVLLPYALYYLFNEASSELVSISVIVGVCIEVSCMFFISEYSEEEINKFLGVKK